MSAIEREVRNQLRNLRLNEAEREEVFAEISAHLEMVVEELVAEGVHEENAQRAALSQLRDHKRLLTRIQRARAHVMRDSFRKVWLPAAVVVLLVYYSQMIAYRFIPEPRSYHVLGTYYVYSWGWLLAEACAGSLGAWWSRAMGGTVRERLIVALAPAEAMSAVAIVTLTLDTIMQVFIERRAPYFVTHPVMVLAAMLWMLHSVVPSFFGALPWLRGGRAHEREQGTQLPA
jgi:hypothetical protein